MKVVLFTIPPQARREEQGTSLREGLSRFTSEVALLQVPDEAFLAWLKGVLAPDVRVLGEGISPGLSGLKSGRPAWAGFKHAWSEFMGHLAALQQRHAASVLVAAGVNQTMRNMQLSLCKGTREPVQTSHHQRKDLVEGSMLHAEVTVGEDGVPRVNGAWRLLQDPDTEAVPAAI